MRLNSIQIRIFVLILFSFFYTYSYSQTGTISGVVSDSIYKESLPTASVSMVGLTVGSQCDMDGRYSIKVNPGTYTMKFSFIGYKDFIVKDVIVEAGKVTTVDAALSEDVMEMDVVEIKITPKTNTSTAVIEEIKESEQVVSGISQEQISNSQDRDAGQAMQRIPGITLIESRFIVVRGLSERYNTVMINDAISPSTSAERRSFAFDLIPSNLLDRMLVYKSGAAELPGDFAGGVIKIYTRNAPSFNGIGAGLTLGYRGGTTFQPFYQSNGSGTDFLGFDNGYRKLPSDFPVNLNQATGKEVESASKSLPNNFAVEQRTAIPDIRFNVGVSKRFFIKEKEVSSITAINYSNTYQYAQLKRKRYLEFEEEKQSSPVEMDFVDDRYSNNIRLGLLSNWIFEFNKRNKIEFKNMFNQLGEHETIIRNGISYNQRAGDSLRNFSLGYTSRSIYSGQLSGNHEFQNNKTSYHWVAGFSYFGSKTPDLRRYRTYKKIGSENDYKLIVPPGATTFDASRFYSDLSEGTIMNSGDLEHKLFDKEKDSTGIKLKVGYYVERKSRNFEARWMSYKSRNNQGADSLSALQADQWFASENIDYNNGFYLQEGTKSTDSYSAQNLLTAGYASLLVPFKKFNIATGLRTEFNRLTLQAIDELDKPLDVDNPVVSLLPFVNISYNLTDKMLVRAAYSKTVNRPEFREIAPFLFYDFENNADVDGNPNLKSATIHNMDVRYELYPSSAETFSIGGFYKRFINPIESYINVGADNPIYYFDNALFAENIGVELEVRKSLVDVFQNRFLQNLSLVFNGSLIKSNVDLGDKAKSQDGSRALQGQSPYVINGGLYYINNDKGLMVNLVYNVFGKRIFIVGNDLNPTVYEMPRHQIDLTVSKRFTEKLEARFGIQDLLNYKTLMLQDSNLDSKITKVDESVLEFRRGSYYTIGINYKF